LLLFIQPIITMVPHRASCRNFHAHVYQSTLQDTVA
jgi:hypothetical protein